MTNCIICLDDSEITFLNLCNNCNNFIVCKTCYNSDKTHSMNLCPHCRTKLTKVFNLSFHSLYTILNYYIYSVIHIIFNVIYSNMFLYYYFPRNTHIHPFVSTSVTHLLVVNNISKHFHTTFFWW